jgi:hypothetical protein
LAKLEIKFQGTQTYQSEIRVTTLIRLLPAEAQELFAFGGVGSNCIAQTHQWPVQLSDSEVMQPAQMMGVPLN